MIFLAIKIVIATLFVVTVTAEDNANIGGVLPQELVDSITKLVGAQNEKEAKEAKESVLDVIVKRAGTGDGSLVPVISQLANILRTSSSMSIEHRGGGGALRYFERSNRALQSTLCFNRAALEQTAALLTETLREAAAESGSAVRELSAGNYGVLFGGNVEPRNLHSDAYFKYTSEDGGKGVMVHYSIVPRFNSPFCKHTDGVAFDLTLTKGTIALQTIGELVCNTYTKSSLWSSKAWQECYRDTPALSLQHIAAVGALMASPAYAELQEHRQHNEL